MRTRLAALLAVLLALVTLAACGVPLDGAPRDIDESGQRAAAAPSPAPGSDLGPKVYMLGPETTPGAAQLQAASRDVAATPDAVLRALLEGLTVAERAKRWRTAIPSGTKLLSTQQQADGTLVVDLSNDFFQATGDFQVRAVAQVVFTACALEGVARVRLLVEGQAQEWPRGDGTLQSGPLTPYAYPDLNPSSQPEYPPPAGNAAGA